jgi:hypothetical protein
MMVEEAHEAVQSMSLACHAVEGGRMSEAEHFLLDVQMRTMRLLRQINDSQPEHGVREPPSPLKSD